MRNLEELKQQGRILLDEKRDECVKQGLLSDEFFEMIQKNKKPMDLLMPIISVPVWRSRRNSVS